jgi:hypothetical protein
MQLLLEEFFRKVYGLSEGKTAISLLIIVRVMIFLIVIGAIVGGIYLIYTQNYIVILIILGALILGEGAHYIRKTREKKVQAQMPKKASKEHAEDMLISEKSKNGGLLKRSGVKNKNLIMDDKNDVLLDKKKVKAFKLKPVQVKKVKRKKL